jgi:basic membrane protein A
MLIIIFPFFAASCGQSGGESQTSSGSGSGSGNQVAFIYKDSSAEFNLSHTHELGRQYVAAQLPDVTTSFVENISAEQAEETLRDLATKGNKLIFATDPEYNEAVLKVAQEFPETFFEVAQGSETAANVATYDGRMYQMFYVAGGYTGELTVSGIIGVVAPEPTVEVIRNINALALSTLLVRFNEDVSIHVKWTGSWNDPEAERQAALELIDEGADVLVQHVYSPEVQKVAEEKAVQSFGYAFDMREFAPTANKTSIVWNWGWYYLERVNAMLDGTWTGEAYLGEASSENFGEGIIDLAPYTYDQIPQIIEAPPMKWRARFVETNRDVFEGPLNAQNGDEVLERQAAFDDEYIYNQMDWFVEGIVGEAPGEPPTLVTG